MQADIHVYLKGGTYRLAKTITLDDRDSGRNGHFIIYQNAPQEKPVLNGGRVVGGWEIHDAEKNIWQASITPETNFRQIYVNGGKAIRARSDNADDLQKTPFGFKDKTAGSLSRFKHPAGMEVVVSPHAWQQSRLPIAGMSGDTVTIQEPCWSVVKSGLYPGYSKPQWLENAYELLTQPGYWFLDNDTSTLYYKARADEDMTKVTVEVPVIEQFFHLGGTSEKPVSNIKFVGLTLRLSNWLRPSTGAGLASSQANQSNDKPDPWTVSAAIDCTGARNVTIQFCEFMELGGDGVNLLTACSDDAVDDCQFHDLSASAVQLGRGSRVDMALKPGSPDIVSNITVSNCTIHDVCTDYQAGCGIFAGLVQNCTISHNEIYNLPYGGISLGWGWGKKVAFTKGNKIVGNKIHDFLRALADSGGIYCNGGEDGGLIEGNYIYGQGNRYGEIYLDDGSTNWTVRHNVCRHAREEEWLLYKGHNNHADGNYTENTRVRDMTDAQAHDGTAPCSVTNTRTLPDAGADAIMQAAGPARGAIPP